MTHLLPKEVIILAGGQGKRLRSVVNNVPKPMALVNGRPFVEYLMDYWISQGIERFYLTVGYLADQVESYFGNEYRGFCVEYVREEYPLGTGGGIRRIIMDDIARGRQVLLVNGDTWYEVDLNQLFVTFMNTGRPITMVLKPMMGNTRYGGVEVDEHSHVKKFGVKKDSDCLINGGCYLLDVEELKKEMIKLPERFSFEKDFIEPMSYNNKIAASIQDRCFLDIGIPEDYHKAAKLIGVDIGVDG